MIVRSLVALLLSCSVAMAGQGMGPGPGVKAYSIDGETPPSFRDTAAADNERAMTSLATADTLTVSANDLVVCFAGGFSSISSVTCGSNTLNSTKVEVLADYSGYYWAAFTKEGAASSSSTCTVTFSEESTYNRIHCASYSGIATTSAVEGSSCNNTGCDNPTYGVTDLTVQNITSTKTKTLAVAGFAFGTAPSSFTATSPFTARTTTSTSVRIFDNYFTASGTIPNQVIGTIPDTNDPAGIMVVFKSLNSE